MSEFQIGDAVYCLASETTLTALGVVAPRSELDADTLDGYDSSAFWRKAENVNAATAAQAANADALDGIDSTRFLRRKTAGGDEAWWGLSSVSIVAGVSVHPHGLGRVPAVVVITRASSPSAAATVGSPMVTGRDAANVSVTWPGLAGAGTAEIFLVVIG